MFCCSLEVCIRDNSPGHVPVLPLRIDHAFFRGCHKPFTVLVLFDDVHTSRENNSGGLGWDCVEYWHGKAKNPTFVVLPLRKGSIVGRYVELLTLICFQTLPANNQEMTVLRSSANQCVIAF